ncbi:MAG: SDR family NAD(P)-dependent oxidoreductase [Gammaproteobacteria bacterium]|nr:SDR family NAD(P)-dependent oxidoreductase [Gammaproteobacteria bacterium]
MQQSRRNGHCGPGRSWKGRPGRSPLRADRARAGRLDILVNNAFALPGDLTQPKPFWEKPLSNWEMIDVGVRSNFVAAWHAARIMAPQESGLIVAISGYTGVAYTYSVVFGTSKSAVDRMARDMAIELKPYNVASISLWQGLTLTELAQRNLANIPGLKDGTATRPKDACSPEFPGRVIAALAGDPDVMRHSGGTHITAELAREYGKGHGLDAGPAQDVVREIQAAGGEAVACTESVATPEGGKAIIDTALEHYGRIDILIHNAGNVRYGSLKEISQEDFRAVVDVHLMGAFHVVRPAFPIMCEAGYGRIVLTSSIGGLYGNNNCVNYGVSKAGMIGLNNVVALEGEAEGVKCNIILPGAVTRMAEGLDTSIYPPMGPELVAPVVGWLAHESCSVTGEMLVSAAGRVARAYIAETPGVYQPSWTSAEVGAQINAIHDKSVVLDFGLHGHVDHLRYSFGMATGGARDS